MKAMEKFTVAEKRWLLVGIALHKIVHPAICQALRTEAGTPVPCGCLDLSAAIDRLCYEPAFAGMIVLQEAALQMRSKVRNKWGHPVMNQWIDKEHFHRCFLAMRKVIDLLPYSSPAVKGRTSMRLSYYEGGESTGNIFFNPYNFFPGGDNSQIVVVPPETSSACCESCGYPSTACSHHPSDANGSRPIQQSNKGAGAEGKKASKSTFSWLHLTSGAVIGFAVGVLLASSVRGKCGEVVRDGSVPIALRLQDMMKVYSHLRFPA